MSVLLTHLFKVVQQQTVGKVGNLTMFVGRYFLSATVKESLKLDSIWKSYAQMKKGPVFFDSQCISFLFKWQIACSFCRKTV